jgi:hypothetical protein
MVEYEAVFLGFLIAAVFLGWFGYITFQIVSIKDVAQSSEDRFIDIEEGLAKGIGAIFHQLKALEEITPAVLDMLESGGSKDWIQPLITALFGDSLKPSSEPAPNRAESGQFKEITENAQEKENSPPN